MQPLNRETWIVHLAELIRPRAPAAAATQLRKMLHFLTDIPDGAFTDQSLRAVAPKLKRSPNFAEVRAAIDDWWKKQPAPSETARESDQQRLLRQNEERAAFLRRDWDDPQGIAQRVRSCEGNVALLRLLAAAVGRWAPQHLGMLPPHILDLMQQEPEPRQSGPPQIKPAYLTPEQLDIAKGRARHERVISTGTVVDSHATEGRYPARDDETEDAPF
jgi:hypothetical protein